MCGTDMNELTEFVMTEFMNERIWMKSYKKDKKNICRSIFYLQTEGTSADR